MKIVVLNKNEKEMRSDVITLNKNEKEVY